MDFNPTRAIRIFLTVITEHYGDFRGRVSRRDFWTYVAVYVVIAIILTMLRRPVGLNLDVLLHLFLFVPTLALIARRLQDTGRNGAIVWLIMIAPWVIAIVFTFSLLGLFAVIAQSVFAFFGLFFLFALPGLQIGALGLGYFVAAVCVFVLCGQPGTPGPNRYGPPATA
jgi:uncharacterized membrane protein YhaH (DUF805 family)